MFITILENFSSLEQVRLIFSLAVFGKKTLRYCYSLGVVVGVVVVQELCHFVIYLLLHKIIMYLKLGIFVHYPKSNPCYQGRQFKMHFFFFFQNNAPFLTFNPVSSTPQPNVGTCLLCSC